MPGFILKLLMLAMVIWSCLTQAATDDRIIVILETEIGNVSIAIDGVRAPTAAEYILGYIDRGQYNGASLYRSGSLDASPVRQLVQGGVLQGALNSDTPPDLVGYGVTLLPDWESTAQSGLQHRRGSVSLARDLLDTGHVIPELVFCLRDIPTMDAGGNGRFDNKGFPIIGEVVAGFDVIEAVSRRERQGATNIAFLRGEILSAPVAITRAYRQHVLPVNATSHDKDSKED